MMTSRSSASDSTPFEALRARALRSLTRSDRTRAELHRTLLRHAPEDLVEKVLDDLTRSGLLSDERAASTRARQARRKGVTRSLAALELTHAGLKTPHVTQAVENEFEGVDEMAELRAQASRLLPRGSDRKKARKAARALIRKGFDPDRVLQVCGLDEDPVLDDDGAIDSP